MADNTTLTLQQKVLADQVFAAYNFGDGITVVASEHWAPDTFDGQDDWRRVVYVKCDTDAKGRSYKVSFHAKFKEGTLSLDEAYAYWVESGSVIGAPGTASAPALVR
jgi:hypothetical protein